MRAALSSAGFEASQIDAVNAHATSNPACELDHVVGKARPAQTAHVLSNSFGVGGTNESLIFSHPEA